MEAGDFAWCNVPGSRQSVPFPAVLLQVEFISGQERRPYQVRFFHGPPDAWVSERVLQPWSASPSAAMRGQRRLEFDRAVRLAVKAGAPEPAPKERRTPEAEAPVPKRSRLSRAPQDGPTEPAASKAPVSVGSSAALMSKLKVMHEMLTQLLQHNEELRTRLKKARSVDA